MLICAAQIESAPCDIDGNIAKHLRFINAAAAACADLVVFPELSLTGYEPKHARELALESGDARLDVFGEASRDRQMTIGIGLPTPAGDGVRIGLVLFHPDGSRSLYCKQLLHDDELPYFVAGREQLVVGLDGEIVVPAICYESLKPAHGDAAAALGATLYLACVAKPEARVGYAHTYLPGLARRHAMSVVMCNAIGRADDFTCAGGSAAWDREGNVLCRAGPADEGLLLFEPAAGRASFQAAAPA